MSQYRPQRATGKPDANHFIVRDFLRDVCGGLESHQEGNHLVYTANLRGQTVWAADTHKLGGYFVDWIIGCRESGLSRWIEIKTLEAYAAKDHSLRPGESYALETFGNVSIVSTDDEVQRLFLMLL